MEAINRQGPILTVVISPIRVINRPKYPSKVNDCSMTKLQSRAGFYNTGHNRFSLHSLEPDSDSNIQNMAQAVNYGGRQQFSEDWHEWWYHGAPDCVKIRYGARVALRDPSEAFSTVTMWSARHSCIEWILAH
jgi:hypothetical protein